MMHNAKSAMMPVKIYQIHNYQGIYSFNLAYKLHNFDRAAPEFFYSNTYKKKEIIIHIYMTMR